MGLVQRGKKAQFVGSPMETNLFGPSRGPLAGALPSKSLPLDAAVGVPRLALRNQSLRPNRLDAEGRILHEFTRSEESSRDF